ncbi:MAG: hypothetical protein M1833_002512 [Piccolia ochrophora]|nr:MAG: hypothetical protein M1833_002512 [Piccolia ochrophora]
MSDPVVSHGRGGTGNIGGDSTKYVDGEIVREAPAGEGYSNASTGRGGVGNLAPSELQETGRKSAEVIPEEALRPSTENQDYHVGRGGQGNVHVAENKNVAHEGLADKLKNKIFKKKE